MTAFGGSVAPGWEPVETAFQGNFDGEDVGAAAAVYHRGVKVVDVWGGSFHRSEPSPPYDDQTLQLVFSTTKGITAIAVAICRQRGLFDYSDTVASVWPEFAAKAKQDATIAQLLSHQCGLFSVQGDITLDEALDWETITARLADTAPEWPIGTAHGYHALTFGWLAGELVRRADPAHRSIGRFVAEEIVDPLGVELWIGLPEALEPRVSPMIGGLATSSNPDPKIQALLEQFFGPHSNAGRALSLNGAFTGDGMFNRREVHAAEIPAANAITNASSLAKIYAATIGEVDGVRLLTAETVDIVRQTVTPTGEMDTCLMAETCFGMGFMTNGPFTTFGGPGSFGHPGAGGSVAFAHPERELSVAYVMNKMASNLAGDARAQRITDAATEVVDALR